MDDIIVNSYESVNFQGKEYIVFNIAITIDGMTHYIKRRYSELLQLHKDLKRQASCSLPIFPPKQIRNFNAKNLETRKRALSQYLYSVFYNTHLHDLLLDYLNIPRLFSNACDDFSLESLDVDLESTTHNPVIQAKADAVKVGDVSGAVINGVLQALYNPDNQVSG